MSEVFAQFHQQNFRLKLLSFNFYFLLALGVSLSLLGGVWYKIAVSLIEFTTLVLCVSWCTDKNNVTEKKLVGVVFLLPLLFFLLHCFSIEVSFPRHEIKNLLAMAFVIIAVATQAGRGESGHNRHTWFILSVIIFCLVLHLAGILVWHRPNGFFDNPHYIALQSIVTINLGFYFVLSCRGLKKVTALAIVLISLLLLSLVVSHIAWVALGCSALVWLYLLFHKRNKKMVGLVVLLLLVGGIFASTLFDYNTALVHNDISTFENVREPTLELFNVWNDERVIIWKDAWTMQVDSSVSQWLVGHGLSNFEAFFPSYSTFNKPGVGLFPIAYVFPHNFILEVLFNSGLFGLLFFLLAVIGVVKYTLRCVVCGNIKPVLALGLFTAVFIQVFFTLPFLSRSSSIYLGLAIGFCLYNCLAMKRNF